MILHLFDDEKVVNRTIAYFEEFLPGQNKFIVLIPHKKYIPLYVNSINADFQVSGDNAFWNSVGDIDCYDEIIIHFLNLAKIRFINSINHSNITWFEWGADLYNQLLEPKGFQLYRDKKEVLVCTDSHNKRYRYLEPLYKILRLARFKKTIDAIKKIKNFAGLDFELDLLMHYYPQFSQLKKKDFFYYPIDDIIPYNFATIKKETNENIMLGNSSSPSGNHSYALKLLSNLDIGNRKVVIPLSYGNAQYRDYIVQCGRKFIGNNSFPLLEFLSLDEYNDIMNSCDYFIYANLRQEAFGNILVALYLGKKVFLDACNPLYDYLRSLSLAIYSLDSLKRENFRSLNDDQVQNNRDIIMKYYSKERLQRIISSQYDYIMHSC